MKRSRRDSPCVTTMSPVFSSGVSRRSSAGYHEEHCQGDRLVRTGDAIRQFAAGSLSVSGRERRDHSCCAARARLVFFASAALHSVMAASICRALSLTVRFARHRFFTIRSCSRRTSACSSKPEMPPTSGGFARPRFVMSR